MTRTQEASLEKIKKALLFATPNRDGAYHLCDINLEDYPERRYLTVMITRRYKECIYTDDTIYLKIGSHGKIYYADMVNHIFKFKPYTGNIFSAICGYQRVLGHSKD